MTRRKFENHALLTLGALLTLTLGCATGIATLATEMDKPQRCQQERTYKMVGYNCANLGLKQIPQILKSNLQVSDWQFNGDDHHVVLHLEQNISIQRVGKIKRSFKSVQNPRFDAKMEHWRIFSSAWKPTQPRGQCRGNCSIKRCTRVNWGPSMVEGFCRF